MPVISPSAGVRATRSSTLRRARWAAIVSAAVLDEAVGVEQVVDVLACGAPARLVPPTGRVGASRVEPGPVAGEGLGQVGADVVGFRRGGVLRRGVDVVDRREERDGHAGGHRVADLDRHGVDPPRGPGVDDVLHLHRLEHHELGAARDDVALGDLDRDDDAVGGAERRPGAGRGRHRRPLRRRDVRDELREVRVDEGGVEGAVDQLRPVEQRPEQGGVHRDAVDVELGQRPPRPHRGLGDRAGGDDHLREQRVVAGADGEPGVAVGVDAHPAPARGLEPDERAGPARHRAVGRDGLGVDAHLQRGAPRRGGGGEAEVREGRAVGHPQTGFDQVETGRLLGDGVLDLDARVHLEEGRLPVRHEELDRRQPRVGRDQARGRVVQVGTDVVGQSRRRRDLDELLTAPLRRAVPVAEHHGAAAVAEHLDLDVACVREQPLDVDGVVTERRAGLGGAQAHGRLERARGR